MTVDLSPGPERFRWYHRVRGWDIERDAPSTCQLELASGRALLIIRLGSTHAGTVGLTPDQVRELVRCLNGSPAPVVLAVAHPAASKCSLLVRPRPVGTDWQLRSTHPGVASWITHFDQLATFQLAELLDAGRGLLRPLGHPPR